MSGRRASSAADARPSMGMGSAGAAATPLVGDARTAKVIAATSHAASPETSVTCRPEMLMRWVTPVRLNTCQSDASTLAWSPIARASNTAP